MSQPNPNNDDNNRVEQIDALEEHVAQERAGIVYWSTEEPDHRNLVESISREQNEPPRSGPRYLPMLSINFTPTRPLNVLDIMEIDEDEVSQDYDWQAVQDVEYLQGLDEELLLIADDQTLGDVPENTDPPPPTNYDLSLPVEHSYLGGLDSIQSNPHLFPPDSVVTLKSIFLSGVFLFPGQEIPLTFIPPNSDFIKDIINSEILTFGIHISSLEDKIGVTAEIRSFAFKEDNTVTIKVIGRQRFKVLDDTYQYRYYNCKARILPEIDLGNFYRPSIQNERYLGPFQRPFLTAHHKWALKFYDNQFMMDQLKSTLMKIFESRIKTDEFSYPVDPTAFSYFVLMAIPFPDVVKTRMMKICCVNFRLRLELLLLSENFIFECNCCHIKLCGRDSFLVMSKSGTSGTFVNKHGIIHELYTFSSVKNTTRTSFYSEDFSWFPNYGWRIINCHQCRIHLGWEFETKKKDIHPKLFYALTKNSIRLAFKMDEGYETSGAYKMLYEPEYFIRHG